MAHRISYAAMTPALDELTARRAPERACPAQPKRPVDAVGRTGVLRTVEGLFRCTGLDDGTRLSLFGKEECAVLGDSRSLVRG
jgi:hypothetical protein